MSNLRFLQAKVFFLLSWECSIFLPMCIKFNTLPIHMHALILSFMWDDRHMSNIWNTVCLVLADIVVASAGFVGIRGSS